MELFNFHEVATLLQFEHITQLARLQLESDLGQVFTQGLPVLSRPQSAFGLIGILRFGRGLLREGSAAFNLGENFFGLFLCGLRVAVRSVGQEDHS